MKSQNREKTVILNIYNPENKLVYNVYNNLYLYLFLLYIFWSPLLGPILKPP